MAQGKARNKEETIEALKPYFKMGCSVLKACNYGGIPQSTVQISTSVYFIVDFK